MQFYWIIRMRFHLCYESWVRLTSGIGNCMETLGIVQLHEALANFSAVYSTACLIYWKWIHNLNVRGHGVIVIVSCYLKA